MAYYSLADVCMFFMYTHRKLHHPFLVHASIVLIFLLLFEMFTEHYFLRKSCGGSTLHLTYSACQRSYFWKSYPRSALYVTSHRYLSVPLELRYDAETSATNRFISKSCSPPWSCRTINCLLFILLEGTIPHTVVLLW